MEMHDLSKLIIAAIVGAVIKELVAFAIKVSPTFARWMKDKVVSLFRYQWRLIPIALYLFIIGMFVSYVFRNFDNKSPATVEYVVHIAALVIVVIGSEESFRKNLEEYVLERRAAKILRLALAKQ